ncbi:MAG: Ty1/Copia family ribonuclease HI [Phycisphaerae bacterium]
MDNGIIFSGRKFDLHVFTDADWAGDRITRRSTTGYVVFAAGGPIIWSSKLQTTVATSSMESEYMAMYGGMQELVWIRGVLSELLLTTLFGKSTPFYIDNQSAED